MKPNKRKERQIAILHKYHLYDDYISSGYKYISCYLKSVYRQGKIKSWSEVYGTKKI